MLKNSLIKCFIMINKNFLILKKIFIIYLFFIFSFIVAFQLFGYSKDYFNYLELLSTNTLKIEPTWSFIRYIFHNNVIYILLFVTFISLLLKYQFFDLNNNGIELLLFYLVTYYLLHEYTQIRVALAIGIYLKGIKYITQRKFWKYFFFYLLAGITHYSLLILFPLYFLYSFRLKIIVIIPYIIFLLSFFLSNKIKENDFISEILIFLKLELINGYYLAKRTQESKVFYLLAKKQLLCLLILLVCYYIFIVKKIKIPASVKLSICCVSYSLILFYICSFTPFEVMATRFSEILIYFAIILLTQLKSFIKEKSIYSLLVFSVVIFFSYSNIIVTGVF